LARNHNEYKKLSADADFWQDAKDSRYTHPSFFPSVFSRISFRIHQPHQGRKDKSLEDVWFRSPKKPIEMFVEFSSLSSSVSIFFVIGLSNFGSREVFDSFETFTTLFSETFPNNGFLSLMDITPSNDQDRIALHKLSPEQVNPRFKEKMDLFINEMFPKITQNNFSIVNVMKDPQTGMFLPISPLHPFMCPSLAKARRLDSSGANLLPNSSTFSPIWFLFVFVFGLVPVLCQAVNSFPPDPNFCYVGQFLKQTVEIVGNYGLIIKILLDVVASNSTDLAPAYDKGLDAAIRRIFIEKIGTIKAWVDTLKGQLPVVWDTFQKALDDKKQEVKRELETACFQKGLSPFHPLLDPL
jgi:hypothetical protein